MLIAATQLPLVLPLAPRAARNAMTLLLVDDTQAVREVLGTVLTMEGYRVLAVPCGEDALEMASRVPFRHAHHGLRNAGYERVHPCSQIDGAEPGPAGARHLRRKSFPLAAHRNRKPEVALPPQTAQEFADAPDHRPELFVPRPPLRRPGLVAKYLR